jgi:Icc-related predicted phosphoesterase
MKVLHTSDIHGNYPKVLAALAAGGFDVWVDTGDFFPNKTRGDRPEEVRYQNRWAILKDLGARIASLLDGRPLISVGGNHDYTSLAQLVRDAGGIAFDMDEGAAVVNGKTFAGFREVPYLMGEWNGETHGADFANIVEATMAANPDVLVTHAPPAGILNNSTHGGVGQLTTALTWTDHKVGTHFFGHIHETQGVEAAMDIQFINGAGRAIVHTI